MSSSVCSQRSMCGAHYLTLHLDVFLHIILSVSFCRLEEVPRPFPLHPCLHSPDDELRFLRCCARLLMLRLLPARDARSRSLRLLLIEVVATKGDLKVFNSLPLMCVSVCLS